MGITVFFGGTFNPPHLAHYEMLCAVSEIERVERVLVVPTNLPPHKELNGFVATGNQRLEMCRIMCEGNVKAVVSDMELKRGGKSYSYYTLTELKKTYSNLGLLIGGDMLTTFDTWFEYEKILQIAEIFAIRRPGVDNQEFDKMVEALRFKGGIITVLDVNTSDVSSTELRSFLDQKNEDVNNLNPKIYDYILKNQLYGRK